MRLIITTLLIVAITAQPKAPAKAISCPNRVANCPADLNPVCGFTTNGDFVNYGNWCTACSRPQVQGYIQGFCSSFDPSSLDFSAFLAEKGVATNGSTKASTSRRRSGTAFILPSDQSSSKCGFRPLSCPDVSSPVCAVKNDNSRTTFPSPCEACKDASVKAYSSGQCKVPRGPAPAGNFGVAVTTTTTQNPPVQYTSLQEVCTTRTPACTRELRYVCAKRKDGSASTYSNKCLACADAEVVSFVQGKCPGAGVVIKPLAPAPSASISATVTATPPTLPAASTLPAIPTVAGVVKCPARSRACTFIYMPVCGRRNDGTSKTYPNNCTACSDQTISGYVPGGPCQGETQIKVTTMTALSAAGQPSGSVTCTSRSPRCTREFVPVCGRRTDGNTQEYSNKCVACADTAVISFTTGGCSAKAAIVETPKTPVTPKVAPTPVSPLIPKTPATPAAPIAAVAPVAPAIPSAQTSPAPVLKTCQTVTFICPKNKDPVCAKTLLNMYMEFDNNCTACQNKLQGYFQGKCPSNINQTSKPAAVTVKATVKVAAQTKIPLLSCPNRDQVCGNIVNPVCGRTVTGQQKTYDNSCLACKTPNLAGYYLGNC